MRLQFVSPPDELYRTYRNANGFGHRPAGPVGGFMRRLGAGQRHHLRGDFCRDRRLAGFAGLVAQQTVNSALGKALLPPPHRWPANPNALRHPLCRVPLRRGEHDARPLDVLTRPVAVGGNRCKLLVLGGAQRERPTISRYKGR